ncbi:MAG: hypothetical protein ACLR4Z_05505 [Butyricicoccaceae bacterium]
MCIRRVPPQAETPPTRQTQPEAPEPTLEEQQQAAAEDTPKSTLEQQTAQLFFARCPDTDAAAEAAEYSPGGYILFGRDFDGRTRSRCRTASPPVRLPQPFPCSSVSTRRAARSCA